MAKLPTPCHIIDLDRLEENLERIRQLKQASGCKILLAAKGFSAPYLFSPMKGTLDGISASGLFEARLGREEFGNYVQTYSPAFRPKDIDEIIAYSDAVIFNSIHQLEQYGQKVKTAKRFAGLRINPMVSGIQKDDANPCRPYSRLGVPLPAVSLDTFLQIDGLHIHCMCEQHADALEKLVDLIIEKIGVFLEKSPNIKWINLGGGQLIGQKDYDIDRAAKSILRLKEHYHTDVILEPCEGIVAQCGYFATEVCDIVENEEMTAILDASPICHMPDAVFRNWRHDVEGETAEGNGYRYFLSGPTCFAGDTFGQYTFDRHLQIGDIIYFKDTASYTWVKNNAFNGIPFPAICTYSKKDGLIVRKTYPYELYFRNL